LRSARGGPLVSPQRSSAAVEAAVLAVRAEHPVWGGRKIARVVERDGVGPVAASTVTGILKRHGVELGQHGGGAHPFIRFEHEAPNDLWQMDFKGHVPLLDGRLHPLTVLDDHSRFAVALEACADETGATVKALLIKAFRRYGLPWRMAVDNGPPWGDAGHGAGFTKLGVWLVEAGVALSHSRPRHPQTLGKDERFHRSLAAEALGRPFADLAKAQAALDAWRNVYNLKRPHDALAGGVPIDHYTPSPRPFRDTAEPFAYAPDDLVRRVQDKGDISLMGRIVRIGKAFATKHVALRHTPVDGQFDAFFRHQKISTIDLNKSQR
jgi:transposase InsO family protein